MTNLDVLQRTILSHGPSILLGLAIFAGVLLFTLRLQRRLIHNVELKRRSTGRLLSGLASRIHGSVLAVFALWCALLPFDFPEKYELLISRLILLILVFQVARWTDEIYGVWLERTVAKHVDDDRYRSTHGLARIVGRMAVWTIAFLVILDNLGVEITTFVAGLGIGGVAIALAVQNILGDLFASLSIVLDRPFVVGDFIVAGNEKGNVEYIGIKSTRIRSLTGEQIVISNADLLGSRIQNYKRMSERRVDFTLTITFDTPIEQIRQMPELLENAIRADERTRFDRAHFKMHGEFGLVFEIVYIVLSSDMRVNMDVRQGINLRIHEELLKRGIQIAYPAQRLFLSRPRTKAHSETLT